MSGKGAAVSDAVSRLAELLMSPEQLDRVDTLRETFSEKQRSVEGQLLAAMQGQLEQARQGILSLEESSKSVETLHNSFQEVSVLCDNSKNQLPEYTIIKRLSTIRENLKSCVENSKNLCETAAKVATLKEMLKDDRRVYEVHKDLHALEELRREALIQTKEFPEEHKNLMEQFKDLDKLVSELEKKVMKVFEECVNMAALRPATLVKAVLVIEREEKFDRRRKVQNKSIEERLRGMKNQESTAAKDLTSRLQPIRGYRAKAFERLQTWIVQHFDFAFADLESDLEITVQHEETAGFALTAEIEDVTQRYLKEADQILADLKLVQNNMRLCMPKHYKIFEFFLHQYHNHFYTLILRFSNQSEILSAKDTLNLVAWVKGTYEKFLESVNCRDIEPSLIEPLEELIRGFRVHIRKLMNQWTPRLIEVDRNSPPEEVLGLYYTDSSVTLFKILNQQIQVVLSTNYPMLTFQVVLECIDAIYAFQQHIADLYVTSWRELEFEYILALINNNKKAVHFVNNYENSVKEILEDYLFSQVNFESVRQGFLEMAKLSVEILAKAICRDFEEVMALTGTREWRDTDDPYMDAVCDTIVDYFENDVKAYIDSEYHNEVYKYCVERVVGLYTLTLLTPSRNKVPIDSSFIKRVQLEKEILFDFGMEMIGFEKFVKESLSPLQSSLLLFQGNSDSILQATQQLNSLHEGILPFKALEFHLGRRSDLEKSQVKSIVAAAKELIYT